MLVHLDVRRFHGAVTLEAGETGLALAFVIPLAEAAGRMRREVAGPFVRESHEDLVDLELEDQMVDLGQFDEAAQGGDGDRPFHFLREVGDAADRRRGFLALPAERFRLLRKVTNAVVRQRGLALDARDELRDVAGRLAGPLGELAHLVCDHREAAPGLAGSGPPRWPR